MTCWALVNKCHGLRLNETPAIGFTAQIACATAVPAVAMPDCPITNAEQHAIAPEVVGHMRGSLPVPEGPMGPPNVALEGVLGPCLDAVVGGR